MNSSPSRQDLVIDEQAATWAARLDGDVLEAGERAALDAWLAKSPAHRAALSQYCQLSTDLEEQLPVLVATGAVAMPEAKKRSSKILSFPRIASIALAAAAAIALAVWVARPSAPVETIVSGVAQRATHTLGDGSRVELNAQTSLRFENTKDERRVRLAAGEAIFMVTKDPSRPFIVETPTGSVRVTGTVFNVRAEPQDGTFEVTVVEGSVEARPRDTAGGPIPLKAIADNRLSTHNGQPVEFGRITAEQVEDFLAWRRGQIVFRDVPLADAVARFARHHGCSITVPALIANETLGGVQAIDDLSGFLSGIESAYSVKCTRDASGAYTFR